MKDDSLDISNSRSKSFDCQSSNKLEKFDEEITYKYLFWPSLSVSKPNELDKILLEYPRESFIKSCLSRFRSIIFRIENELKELNDPEHKLLYWLSLFFAKPNELDKISLEYPREILMKSCLSRVRSTIFRSTLNRIKYHLKELDYLKDIPQILYSINNELEVLNDLNENYLSVSKKLSNKIYKTSLTDSRESLLKSRLSQLQHILYTIKNESEIFDDLNKILSKFTYDKATYEHLKKMYNNIDTIKYSFDDVRDYTINFINIFNDNIHNKQFINIIVKQKQIDPSTKLLLDCTMTILSINCCLSDGNEEFVQQIVNYGNIFDTLKQILQQLGQIMQPFSFAEQLFENVILLLSNIYRYHRSTNDILWITRMTQYFRYNDQNDVIKICCSLIIASLFTNENTSKTYLQMKHFLKDQLDEAERNKETEWNGFSVVELQEGYSKL